MTITTAHPASTYGIPVILADDGTLLAPGPGIRAVRDHLGLSRPQLGKALGVSARTVEAWEQGKNNTPPATKHLYNLASLLPS